ncbi:MAG: hypothetical protein V5A21_11880 [Halapricum sp.]
MQISSDRSLPLRASGRRIARYAAVTTGLLVAAVQPAVAQDGGDGGSGGGLLDGLGDIIIGALTELLRILFSPIRSVIEDHGDALLDLVVGTPHPDAVFSAPTNGPWPNIYSYYWETIVPLSLSLFGLSIGLVIFFQSTSHLFSTYHRTKLKKRAFSGLLGILSWWWIAALSLRFIDSLAAFLIPSVSDISLFQTLSFTGMGVLGLVLTLSTDFVLFVLIGLIYLVRQLVLYLFVLLMPILIVFWIPGVGPFSLVAKFMRRLAGFYVPFLFMTIPVALLFRVGDLLGQSADFSATGIGAWLTALVIPFAAVASPFVLFWQAGLILFVADRASRHVSAQRARNRLSRGRERVRQTGRGGRNFIRGVRDKPAIRGNGQTMLDSGDSRAHAAGQRVNRGGSRLRGAFSNRGDGGGRGGSGGGSSSGDSGGNDGAGGRGGSDGGDNNGGHGGRPDRGPHSSSDDGGGGGTGDDTATNDGGSRSDASRNRDAGRDELRDPRRSSQNRDAIYVDDEPRYLQ